MLSMLCRGSISLESWRWNKKFHCDIYKPLLLPFFFIGDVSNQIFLVGIIFDNNIGKKTYTSIIPKFSLSCGKVSYLTLFLVWEVWCCVLWRLQNPVKIMTSKWVECVLNHLQDIVSFTFQYCRFPQTFLNILNFSVDSSRADWRDFTFRSALTASASCSNLRKKVSDK